MGFAVFVDRWRSLKFPRTLLTCNYLDNEDLFSFCATTTVVRTNDNCERNIPIQGGEKEMEEKE